MDRRWFVVALLMTGLAAGPAVAQNGACCFPSGLCGIMSAANCAAMGGEFQGPGTICVPDPCPEPEGACCFPGGFCEELEQIDCNAAGGLYQGNFTTCIPGLCPGPPQACCLPNGSCMMLQALSCMTVGGVPQGPGTTCMPNPCVTDGACCFDSGACQVLTEAACGQAGGIYQGDDTACVAGTCVKGACCLPNGLCAVLLEASCAAQGGVYQGDDTVCQVGLCVIEGACCFDSGVCEETTQDDCDDSGGVYQGDDTVCAAGTCVKGACCLANGLCAVLLEDSCAGQGGVYQGDDTVCQVGLCLGEGACCFDSGACEETTQDDCDDSGGVFQGDDTTCAAGICVKGACCLAGGACAVILEESCLAAGGTYQGDNVICTVGLCGGPPTGACCLPGGGCTQATQQACIAAGGLFQGNGTVCVPGLCPPGGGACCLPNGTCIQATQSACAAAGGLFQGNGTVCSPGLCPPGTGACCLDDGACVQASGQACAAQGGDFQGAGSSCANVDCPLVAQSCCQFGKPRVLTMIYTAETCAATMHSQAPGKVECNDFGALPNTVFIVANDKDKANEGKIWFQGTVSAGQAFDISATNAGENKLKSNSWIHIFTSAGGQLRQKIKFHTSCSQPLNTGDQFGAALLVGCTGEDEPVEGSCCEFGKPRVLTMEYTAQTCAATMHGQASGKVECDDFGPLPATAWIVANDKKQSNEGKIWFQGTVSAGGTFNINAANAGENKLKSNTYIHVMTGPNGQLRQRIKFHTSCSQPLFAGNQFGSALLVDCIGEDEPGAASLSAPRRGEAPTKLFLEYTGEGCVAGRGGAGPAPCTGDPDFEPLVRILASDAADPEARAALVYHDSIVPLGTIFAADAAWAGASRLAETIWVHVFDLTGRRLQSLAIPAARARAGDRIGAVLLDELVFE